MGRYADFHGFIDIEKYANVNPNKPPVTNLTFL
jgi:hypothetical protein